MLLISHHYGFKMSLYIKIELKFVFDNKHTYDMSLKVQRKEESLTRTNTFNEDG